MSRTGAESSGEEQNWHCQWWGGAGAHLISPQPGEPGHQLHLGLPRATPAKPPSQEQLLPGLGRTLPSPRKGPAGRNTKHNPPLAPEGSAAQAGLSASSSSLIAALTSLFLGFFQSSDL